jgi:predicted ATPase
VLFEETTVLAKKRDQLLEQLGGKAALVTSLVPNLESIIGKQEHAAVEGATVTEMQNLLLRCFVILLRVLSGFPFF